MLIITHETLVLHSLFTFSYCNSRCAMFSVCIFKQLYHLMFHCTIANIEFFILITKVPYCLFFCKNIFQIRSSTSGKKCLYFIFSNLLEYCLSELRFYSVNGVFPVFAPFPLRMLSVKCFSITNYNES